MNLATQTGNSPAFPIEESLNDCGSINFGLTKREYFAAMAMQGMIASEIDEASSPEGIAKMAAEHADALLKALES